MNRSIVKIILHEKNSALALETQYFPNALKHKNISDYQISMAGE